MYFYVNFNVCVFFLNKTMHLLVRELYMYQNAWCSNKNLAIYFNDLIVTLIKSYVDGNYTLICNIIKQTGCLREKGAFWVILRNPSLLLKGLVELLSNNYCSTTLNG